jgi:hypothetical protein
VNCCDHGTLLCVACPDCARAGHRRAGHRRAAACLLLALALVAVPVILAVRRG